MTADRLEALADIASEVRKDIVRMVGVARSGSIDIAFSITNLLVYIYWEELLIVPDDIRRSDRDRFLLGIEDGVPALYAVLARRGCFGREDLWHYRRLGATLQPLPELHRVPGIDAPTVPNGNELSVAVGLASAIKMDGLDSRVFCLSDITLCDNDDFVREAETAFSRKLNNIVQLIVFRRSPEGLLEVAKCEENLKSSGWRTVFADGHDFTDMERAFSSLSSDGGVPTAVLVGTEPCLLPSEVNGSGAVKVLNIEDMIQVLEELEAEADE